MRWEQYGGMEALAFDMGTKLDGEHLIQSRCNGGDWCKTRLGVCANASLYQMALSVTLRRVFNARSNLVVHQLLRRVIFAQHCT